MPVKLSSSGGGSVTLTPPSTASNYTVTLPAANATLADTSSTQTLTNKTLTAAGSNTVEATSGPTSTQLAGQRNKIINGAMMIDQRNAGASVTLTNISTATYTLDRWAAYPSVASKIAIQQNAGSVTPPVGFTNYLGATSLSSYSVGSGEYYFLEQIIEGYNVADLAFGTANAATITLSFKVYSSLTGTFSGSISNSTFNRSYPFTFNVSVANTWTTAAVTIPGDTSGTWYTNNGIGMYVLFNLGSGANNLGTAGAWTAAAKVGVTGSQSIVATNGATFYITGVQLEKGATATPFENRLYGTELALCQRYFYTTYNTGIAPGTVSTNGALIRYIDGTCSYASLQCNFPVSMRTSPTVTIYNPTTGVSGSLRADAANVSGGVISSYQGEKGATAFVNNVSLSVNVGVSAHMTASAEL